MQCIICHKIFGDKNIRQKKWLKFGEGHVVGVKYNFFKTFLTKKEKKSNKLQGIFEHESIDYIKAWSLKANMVIYPGPF